MCGGTTASGEMSDAVEPGPIVHCGSVDLGKVRDGKLVEPVACKDTLESIVSPDSEVIPKLLC